MGKGSGSTRASSSGNPRGLTETRNATPLNIISNTQGAQATRENRIEWYRENGQDVENRVIDMMNDNEAFYGNAIQLSKTENGNRAIRIFMDGGTSPRYTLQNREINRFAEDLRRRYNLNVYTSVDKIRGRNIGYIEFIGWK